MPDEKVTDEQLDTAADVVEETVVAEEVKEEEIETKPEETEEIKEEVKEDIPQEPDKLQQFELSLNEIKYSMQDMFDQFNERLASNTGVSQPAREEEIDMDAPATVGDIARIIRDAKAEETAKAQEKQQASTEYHNGYVKSLTKLGRTVTNEEYEVIYNKMVSDYDTVITGKPEVDAELNWHRAKADVVKSSAPTNPVTGNRNTGPSPQLDVTTTNTAPAPVKKMKLDKVAEEFVKMSNMDDDTVNDALTGQPANHLFGGGKI